MANHLFVLLLLSEKYINPEIINNIIVNVIFYNPLYFFVIKELNIKNRMVQLITRFM